MRAWAFLAFASAVFVRGVIEDAPLGLSGAGFVEYCRTA
jgi:hypothetical protein